MPAISREPRESFEPEAVAIMGDALDESVRAFGVVDDASPAVGLIAKRIVELHQHGQRDPAWLRNLALRATR